MKKALALGLAALFTSGVARAEFSLSTDLTLATDYIFRGVQLGENTLHPSIEFSQDSFYLGYWGANPINNTQSKGWNNEYDFYAGYSQDIAEGTSVDVGVTYYYYTQYNLESTTEGYVGITGDFGGVTPGFYVYYDFTLKNITYQGSVGYSIPMKDAGTSLDLSATVGFVDVDGGDSYTYYGVSAVMPFQINDSATFSVGLHYSNTDLDGGDTDFIYGTAGITIGF